MVDIEIHYINSVCISVSAESAASGDHHNGSSSSSGTSRGLSRYRLKRMLARDSSHDTFLCDAPGGSALQR